jgi:hypothetical protein
VGALNAVATKTQTPNSHKAAALGRERSIGDSHALPKANKPMAKSMVLRVGLQRTPTAAPMLRACAQAALGVGHEQWRATAGQPLAKAITPKCPAMATGALKPWAMHHWVIKVSEPIITAMVGSTEIEDSARSAWGRRKTSST